MPRQTKANKLDDVKNTISDTNVNTYDDVINDDIIENSFDNSDIESNTDNDTPINTTDERNIDKQQEKEQDKQQDKQIENNNKEEQNDKIRLSDFDELINQIDKTETDNEKGNKEKVTERDVVKEEKVPKQRDYSVFSEEEQKLFKGTSNEVYEYLKNILPKLKETESKYQELLSKQQETQQQSQQKSQQQTQSKPTSFYDHPEAYLLSEEYRNTAIKGQMYDAEERHWTEQLQRLRSGETKLTDFIGYDEKGNPKFSEIEIKPDMVSKAEVQLIKNIQAATYAKQNAFQELSKYTETHKKNYSDSISKIKEMENNFLSMYNEKSPRYKDIQTFINNIPPAFHNDPLLSPMSKMYAMILDLIDIAKKMKDNPNNTTTGNANDIKKKLQPSVSELKPGGNTDVIVYSPDEYKDEI